MADARLRRFFSRFFPVIFVYGLITALSSIPGNRFPKAVTLVPDCIPHMLEFALIGYTLRRAFPPPQGTVNAFWIGLAGALIDEAHQSSIPERIPAITDLLSDLGGLIMGLGIYFLIHSCRRRPA